MKYLDTLIAVGGRHAHTELYNFELDQWSQGPDYPYKSYLYTSPICHYNNKFIIFAEEAVIAAFDTNTQTWSQIGRTLNSSRYHHNAIQLPDDNFLVFGGTGSFATEKCTWDGDQLKCSAQDPTVYRYTAWPELFHVPDNYCQ